MNGEKRTSARVPVNLTTRWHGASGTHEGRVEDLSLTGCFINTKGAVDEGETVSFLVQLPSGRWLALRGKVAFYQQLTGFSVSFSILDGKERETLKELVAKQNEVT